MTHPLELYSAYLDGRTLSGVEIETLRKWLKDERNLAEFIEFAILHAAVMDRLKLGQLLEDLASRRGSEVVAPRMLADAIRDIEMHSPRVVVPMPKSQAQAPPQRSPAAPLLQHVVTVAASIAIFCGSAWMLWKFLDVAPPLGNPPLAQVAPAPPKVVAQLVASFDARWPEGVRRRPGERFVERSRLNLLSGSAYLKSTAGALLSWRAPVTSSWSTATP